MNLKDLLGYSNRKGNGAMWNFRQLLRRRLKKWVKHDSEAAHRLFLCEFHADYDWLNDQVKVAVIYDGRLVFTITDPDDHEQMLALSATLQMLE